MRRRAFTLMELLVVIAILSIIAAILFPTFARAREKGRQATCQANLKQIGMAMLMYTQDYDDTLPLYAADWSTVIIQPYINNQQIVTVCPSASYDPKLMHPPISYAPVAYGLNGAHRAGGYPTPPFTYSSAAGLAGPPGDVARLAMAKEPARCVWVADSMDWGMTFPENDLPESPCGYAYWGGRHFGGNETLYLDGHVKWTQMLRLKDPDDFALEGDGLPPDGFKMRPVTGFYANHCRPPGQ